MTRRAGVGFLDGITVLDLSAVGPATRASGWLADYGADVIKVAPLAQTAASHSVPSHAYSAGRGTRRIRIDLKAPAGRALFLQLAGAADVVIESFRPGVVDRLGIGPEQVRTANPRAIYCSTTGYGQGGPRARWAGHDLDYLAIGGYLANSESADGGKPPLPGVTVADTAAGGMHAVMAILAALLGRDRTGQGARLDVSVTDGVLALMSMQIDGYLASGEAPGPGTAPLDGRYACYDTYRAGDGGWLAVAAIERAFWTNLCRAIGLEEYAEKQWDLDAQPEIAAALARAFAARGRDDWVDELADADTCVAPVLSVDEVAAEHQQTGRAITRATLPDGQVLTQLAPLLAGAQAESSYAVPGPSTTQTDDVLIRIGMTAAEIGQLRADGVIG
jgi:alpha-methylacyl-CoA racemase